MQVIQSNSVSAQFVRPSQLVCLLLAVRGGGNPITPDEGNGTSPNEKIPRSAQDFSNITEWGSSWQLDSASTTWVPPTGGPMSVPGMIAAYDDAIMVSPLVTATVKADPGGLGSEIGLILEDLFLGPVPDFEPPPFSAPPGMTGLEGEPYCRYPTVEVSYSRIYYSKEGTLNVYVAWSQLSKMGDELHWDLYGSFFQFEVNSTGIDFANPWIFGPFPIPGTEAGYFEDELQPDLALMPNGDLLLVFMQSPDEDFTSADLRAIRFDYDPFLPGNLPLPQLPYTLVTAPGGYPLQKNMAPSVDVGQVNAIVLDPPPFDEEHVAVCTWFQLVLPLEGNPPNPYEVWYVCWDALSDSRGSNLAVTVDSGANVANALPKVDITPPTAISPSGPDPLRQAVIGWTQCDFDPEQPILERYTNPRVRMTVLQNPIGSIYEITDANGIAPDIACYERSAPDQDQWFGVSFYQGTDSGPMPWEWDNTSIRSYSFDDSLTLTERYYTWIDKTPVYWTLGSPFTGPSLCLRNPAIPDVGNEPYLDIFGSANIQGDAVQTTVWTGEGIIY